MVVGLAVVDAGCTSVGAASPTPRDQEDGSAPSAGSQTTPAASPLSETELSGVVYDLVYDEARDVIWWAILRYSGPDELVEFDPVARTVVRSWALPEVEYNGFTTRLAIRQGQVWVSEPYRLVRLDPDTGKLDQIEFEALPNPTADPSADSAPLTGTWVSSFAFWDDAIWVARNNLSYVTRVDPVTMQATEELPIPNKAAGSEDMIALDGSLYLSASFSSVAGVWVIDASGGAVALPVSARRFTASGTAIAGYGGNSFLIESGSGVLADVVPEPGSPTDRFAAIPDSADLVAYSDTRNAIVRLSNGRVITSIGLARASVTKVNPLGQPISTFVKSSVTDVVVDVRGTVWYVNESTRTLVGTRL